MPQRPAHTLYDNYYQMMADAVRNNAYKSAIFNTVQKGDVVIDLGAGLGILSIWAVQAGAKKVYAIEKTETIELAKEIAKENGCEKHIEFIQDLSTNVTLAEKADILISETLGSFGIDEQTLFFTHDCCERLLKDNARIIPQHIDLYVAAVQHQSAYDKINIWRQVPDINLEKAYDVFSSKMLIETVSPDQLISDPIQIAQYSLNNLTETTFNQQTYLTMNKATSIHGVAGWFTVQLDDQTFISTAPDQSLTHWKQAVFPFQQTIDVIKNDILEWRMSLEQHPDSADFSAIQYSYRCTQLKNELQQLRPSDTTQRECPCGSGLPYSECCMPTDQSK